eukprot:1151919-Pelagomonas_calceolata.AAC.7
MRACRTSTQVHKTVSRPCLTKAKAKLIETCKYFEPRMQCWEREGRNLPKNVHPTERKSPLPIKINLAFY